MDEGTLTISGSNDVLTMALGTAEHGGRVRGVGGWVPPSTYFHLPKRQRLKFGDKLKESLREILLEENEKNDARTRELLTFEREYWMKQICTLIPSIDPTLLKPPSTQMLIPKGYPSSPNVIPTSEKASCSGANKTPIEQEVVGGDKVDHDEELIKTDLPHEKVYMHSNISIYRFKKIVFIQFLLVKLMYLVLY